MKLIYDLYNLAGPDWRAAISRPSILVLNLYSEAATAQAVAQLPGAKVLYRDRRAEVVYVGRAQ